MANYVNLELDTLGPQGVSLVVNDGEAVSTVNVARIKLSCSDPDTTGYQIKLWGTLQAPTEAEAKWSSFTTSGTHAVSAANGIKTIYVKVRDDVYNESPTVSASFKLSTDKPTVKDLYIGPAKVSLMEGKNIATGSFGYSENISAAKMMIVQDVNATHDNQTNILIPTTNGSCFEYEDGEKLSTDKMSFENKECDAIFTIIYNINAKDIAAVAPGDGVKIIKVFVKSAESGLWSV